MESDDFERQVERILRVLEDESASVTWNEHIPDPDNPAQSRQIDVSIRRDDKFTLVECRARSRPQDVNWIEELYGRKVSLNADCVMAVSASGFTTGAEKKAAKLGIFTRVLSEISDEEIKSWGRHTDVRLSYVQFRDIHVFLVASPLAGPSVVQRHSRLTTSSGAPWPIDDLFRGAASAVVKHKLPDGEIVTIPCGTKDLLLGGTPINGLVFQARWHWIHRNHGLPAVFLYRSSFDRSDESVHVEKGYDAETEILHTPSGVFVIIDVAAAHPRNGAYLRQVDLDMGQPLAVSGMQLIGLEDPILGVVGFKTHVIPSGSGRYRKLLRRSSIPLVLT